MDFLAIFQMTANFFTRLCNVTYDFGGFSISLGAVFIFSFLVGICCRVLFKLMD